MLVLGLVHLCKYWVQSVCVSVGSSPSVGVSGAVRSTLSALGRDAVAPWPSVWGSVTEEAAAAHARLDGRPARIGTVWAGAAAALLRLPPAAADDAGASALWTPYGRGMDAVWMPAAGGGML